MELKRPVILTVNDEQFNLELIKEYLSEENIELVCVDRGEQALSILHKSPQRFSAVLLDRMMPGINGMEVLSKIKADDRLKLLPVIMQTAKSGKEQMLEGLNAGAHYYLPMPYSQLELITIVFTAIRDYQNHLEILHSFKQTAKPLKMMDKGEFSFKSPSEARDLSALLANFCPYPDNVILGLTELMINAVEHGNLGITYKDKSELNTKGLWENEVVRRLELPINKDKNATIEFNRTNNEITFLIADQGNGFDWSQYMEISPERAFDSHGRGIAMANSISFTRIEYLDSGNKVFVTVLIN